MNASAAPPLREVVQAELERLSHVTHDWRPRLEVDEVGVVASVGSGVATVHGLPGVRADEVVRFAGGEAGLALDLRRDDVGVVVLGPGEGIAAGAEVARTGRVLDVPVGEALLGRVVDALGRPLDGAGPVVADARWPVERPAPPIFAREAVRVPLQTGVKVVDALFPIGRGQRELIVGDRQTGKTTLALTAVLAQRSSDVRCVVCTIGQRGAATARWLAELRARGALERTAVVVAASDDAPGLRYVAPYAATSIAEAWMEAGHDVLLVLDDLTQHARAYRELSLLLRRPPGREAFPGDIFYLHARLLERATNLRDGGSLTALPIIETQAQDLSAYIPTNLISITDGQLYLSPELAARGTWPAVDVGRSVSRVGGKAQSDGYRAVAGDLRLATAQFEELEGFSRFGTELDEDTRRVLRQGRRVRAVLAQGAFETMPVGEQLAVLWATVGGAFDAVAPERMAAAEARSCERMREEARAVLQRLEAGAVLGDDDRARIEELAHAVAEAVEAGRDGGA
ncbi:MAG: F0F1 ATP synthase subunit alpha [Trueperaceae bacterium]|nr:F0F1 ATP synthase subunit alpha [Trueperaceae bacterium]